MKILRTEAPLCACGEHAWVRLTRGGVALVDPEDAGKVAGRYWYQTSRGYAQSDNKNGHGPRVFLMHRVVTDAGPGQEVDHKDGDRADNRKRKIRVCTVAENQWNSGIQSNNTSGIKGVSWETRRQKWRAVINIRGVRMYLGSFDDPSAAAEAYEMAARKYRGEFYRPSGVISRSAG